MESRYALRSIRRNLRRTILSVLGIATGCVLALFMESLNRGRAELFARAGVSSGVGHLRIVPDGWRERRDPRLRLADWRADVAAARATSGVTIVTTRTRAQVLLAVGTHVVPMELVGVEASTEPATFRPVRQVQHGRYLRAGESGALVVGQAIADRLTAGLDDDVVATAVGPGGNIQSALLRIVGVVSTGSDDADSSVCQVARSDVETLTGLPGAGEVTLVIEDFRRIAPTRAALASRVAAGDEVLTLTDIAPEVEGHLRQDAASSRFVSAVILVIVLLGVAIAQLAAVLERRREFAVLAALGMSGVRMAAVIVQEALLIGLAGAAVALAAGVPLVWRVSRHGLDFTRYLGSSYAFGGMLLDPIIFGDFGLWIVPYVVVVSLLATVIASSYPAWFAARSDPAVALRVAQ